EKVLFPKGDTASKIEGHETLEEFKSLKEDRIKELEEKLKEINKESSDIYTEDVEYTFVKYQLERLRHGIIPESYRVTTTLGGLLDFNILAFYHKGEIAVWQDKDIDPFSEKIAKSESENQHGVKFWILKDSLQKDLIKESLSNLEKKLESLPKEILKREKEYANYEINQLKQELERVEREGFGALRPIWNFYENTVTNILDKQGYNPVEITDEYGNTWNEITIDPIRDLSSILFNKNQDNNFDVILPIGTSGSGKSTFIKSLPQENLVVIEPDAMRVEFTGDMNDKSKDKEIYEEAAKRAIAAIKRGKHVVFDTTNLTKDKRLPFIEAIKKAIPDATIQYKLMELNPELAKQRIKADIAAGKNRANVPDATIDRHAESYKQMLEDIKSEPISNFDVQQEQLKKFAELQERLNDKEFLEGAKNAFESSEELQKLGTQ